MSVGLCLPSPSERDCTINLPSVTHQIGVSGDDCDYIFERVGGGDVRIGMGVSLVHGFSCLLIDIVRSNPVKDTSEVICSVLGALPSDLFLHILRPLGVKCLYVFTGGDSSSIWTTVDRPTTVVLKLKTTRKRKENSHYLTTFKYLYSSYP